MVVLEMADKNISFAPVSEGLGFHPFSEGLPYTPVHPIPRRQMGMGAVAAGLPVYAPPQAEPAVSIAADISSVSVVSATEYLGRRLLAAIIDNGLNIGAVAIALGWVLWRQRISLEIIFSPAVLAGIIFFLLFFNWAIITAQEIAFGTSFGKRICGLEIPGSVSVVLVRAILFIPSTVFCGAGLLWALVDKQNRCWHDAASGIQPELIHE